MDSRTRRGVLAAFGSGLAGAAGCGALPGTGREEVSLLAAGSLQAALAGGLAPAVDAPLRTETRGSAGLARLVAAGRKTPDVVSVADVALFHGPLRPAWYATFATNALVVAYDPGSPGGRRVADAGADGWFEPVLAGDVAFGRTDPDLDPLGYRTLFCLDRASAHYDTDVDLRAALPEPGQVYPETQLLARFETGALEAAVTYRSMAESRGYAYLDLPAAVDLSDPALAGAYASTSYTLPGGRVVEGAPIRYGSTVRGGRDRAATRAVFEAHTTGEYLAEYGFGQPDSYPRYRGEVPRAIRE